MTTGRSRKDVAIAAGTIAAMFVVYNANGREIASYDSQPTKYAARELLLRGTTSLNYVVGLTPQLLERSGFQLARDGRYRSAYSPVPAIITAGIGQFTPRRLPAVEERSAGGVVVDVHEGEARIAVIARRNRAGRVEWCLPKGHIEGAETLHSAVAEYPTTFETVVTEATDTAVILYTSGTTGRPKGAELSHANLLLNALTCNRQFGVAEHDVHLITLPLFHSFGSTVQMNAGFSVGATLVLPRKLGSSLAGEMLLSAKTYYGHELKERGVPFPVLPRADVLPHALELAETLAEKPRISLVTLKSHLVSELRAELPHYIEREVAMHAKTFHQPEVRALITSHYTGG